MTRVIALTRALPSERPLDLLRAAIVCACAIALIAAGNALPF